MTYTTEFPGRQDARRAYTLPPDEESPGWRSRRAFPAVLQADVCEHYVENLEEVHRALRAWARRHPSAIRFNRGFVGEK